MQLPVLPSPQPKQHAKGKGKVKGKETDGQTAEVLVLGPRRRSHVISIFIKKACRKGKDCEYSHDQKVFDANKNTKGNGRKPGTPRSQSPANKTKKIDEPCWHWAKGKCRYGDKCNKRHDPHLFNTAPNTEASSSKATPALVPEWSDDEGTYHKVASNVVKKKVRFDESKTCIQTYVKKDFVKCSRKSQTIPKGHGKVGKPTDQIRQDEQWSYSCRLASSRGKAMAILIDEKDEYSDIDEVLVIVGPSLDILIRFDIEDGEVSREVFVENIMFNMSRVDMAKGVTRCVSLFLLKKEIRDSYWILEVVMILSHPHEYVEWISQHMMIKSSTSIPANGVTCSTKRSSIKFEAFNEPAEAHILEDTPSVISMGKRCVDLGYSFVWPTGKTPVMLDPNGNIIEMTVKDYIPLCECRSREEKAKIILREKIMAVFDDECSTSEGEGLLVIDGEGGMSLRIFPTPLDDPMVNLPTNQQET